MKKILVCLITLLISIQSGFAAGKEVIIDQSSFSFNKNSSYIGDVASSCHVWVAKLKQEYVRALLSPKKYFRNLIYTSVNHYNKKSAVEYDSGLYAWADDLRKIQDPRDVKFDCQSVLIKIDSQLKPYNIHLQATVKCVPRTFKEKIALRMAKECELQPNENCFNPEIVKLVDSSTETTFEFDLKNICSGDGFLD